VHSLLLLVRVGEGSLEKGVYSKAKFAMRTEPVAIFLVAFVFLVIWFVCGLCLFHLYLVLNNKTTFEQLRGLYEFGSVYSIGLLGNVKQMCCTIPDSSVHIHHKSICPTVECEEIQKRTVFYVDYLGSKSIKKLMAHPEIANVMKSPCHENVEI